MFGPAILFILISALCAIALGCTCPATPPASSRWFVFAGYGANGDRMECRVGLKQGNGPEANPFPPDVFSSPLGHGWDARIHAEWSVGRLNAA